MGDFRLFEWITAGSVPPDIVRKYRLALEFVYPLKYNEKGKLVREEHDEYIELAFLFLYQTHKTKKNETLFSSPLLVTLLLSFFPYLPTMPFVSADGTVAYPTGDTPVTCYSIKSKPSIFPSAFSFHEMAMDLFGEELCKRENALNAVYHVHIPHLITALVGGIGQPGTPNPLFLPWMSAVERCIHFNGLVVSMVWMYTTVPLELSVEIDSDDEDAPVYFWGPDKRKNQTRKQ